VVSPLGNSDQALFDAFADGKVAIEDGASLMARNPGK